MKHFKIGKCRDGTSRAIGLVFAENVFSVYQDENGNFVICEDNFGDYCKELTKEQMLEMIEELKAWVESK